MKKLSKVLLITAAILAVIMCAGCLNFGETPAKQDLVVSGEK